VRFGERDTSDKRRTQITPAARDLVNVVLWRVPGRASILSPGSHCPACGRPLKAWELVPVVSWALLRGRCRTCTTTISLRYPLIESAFGAVGLLVAWLVSH
jgi:leader peptidase (prepilin peptidase)/N-methyltransferase